MKKITVDAKKAFSLMLDLFKSQPWLNEPGIMTPDDATAEGEAVAFLLTAGTADGWGNCTPPARRVANSLLIDFLGKLKHPESPLKRNTWMVSAGAQNWQKALEIVGQEIRKAHPHFSTKH